MHVYITFITNKQQQQKTVRPSWGLRMFLLYAKVDVDGGGEVSLEEFHRHFDIDVTKFSERVFGYLDLDDSGELNFNEFVVGIWNFCTFDSKLMVKFAFDLFDVDKSGDLSAAECDALVRMLYGERKNTDVDVASLIADMDTDGDGSVTMEELHNLCVSFKPLMKPAFDMQEQLRKKLIGVKFWKKKMKARVKEFELQSVEEILLRQRKMGLEEKKKQFEEELARLREERLKMENASEEELAAMKQKEAELEAQRLENETKEECRERLCKDEMEKAQEAYYAESLDTVSIIEYAKLKNAFQEAANNYFDATDARFEQESLVAYETAVKKEELKAELFFSDKQGKKYLKIVGKELAQRTSNSRFGLLSKHQKSAGIKRAKQEYIAKKTMEACKVVQQEYADLRMDRDAEHRGFMTTHDLLFRHEQESSKWQWQELYNDSSRSIFWFNPGVNGVIWHEPNISNPFGGCMDVICSNMATLRCAQCHQMEFCYHCNLVAHAVGQKKRHTEIMQIPEAEQRWRLQMKRKDQSKDPISDEHMKRFIKTICTSELEIVQRGLVWPLPDIDYIAIK